MKSKEMIMWTCTMVKIVCTTSRLAAAELHLQSQRQRNERTKQKAVPSGLAEHDKEPSDENNTKRIYPH